MDERLFFSATERNRISIGEVLSKILPNNGFVLQIASGSGEHGVTFQKQFPSICWQTSDPEPSHRKSISAWIDNQRLTKKMPEPIDLDVEKRPWPLSSELRSSLLVIICINMLHISPWSCTQDLFEEAGNLLEKGQILMLYGPFKINGQHTSYSNIEFDHSLRAQNSSWGVRELHEVCEIGTNNGLEKFDIIEMPANNLSVIFKMKSRK